MNFNVEMRFGYDCIYGGTYVDITVAEISTGKEVGAVVYYPTIIERIIGITLDRKIRFTLWKLKRKLRNAIKREWRFRVISSKYNGKWEVDKYSEYDEKQEANG